MKIRIIVKKYEDKGFETFVLDKIISFFGYLCIEITLVMQMQMPLNFLINFLALPKTELGHSLKRRIRQR